LPFAAAVQSRDDLGLDGDGASDVSSMSLLGVKQHAVQAGPLPFPDPSDTLSLIVRYDEPTIANSWQKMSAT
jgi:hypothetical protein